MSELSPIELPPEFNYIAAFLTFSCQLRCSYCINHHGGDLVKGRWMSGSEWVKGLNRIVCKSDIPVTLQGGEPSVHKDFINIVKGVRPGLSLDVLTNLERDIDFWQELEPARLRRSSPYASIRVSYHHGQSTFDNLLAKVKRLHEEGYHIGIWEVDHPAYHGEVIVRQQQAHSMGIDYRLKEFLGPYNGRVYGTMRYQGAVNDHILRSCDCRTSELIIGPDGSVFRCHSDLYANRLPVGNLLDAGFTGQGLGNYRPCAVYGRCNSCDIKVKTNRFQEYGHSSVEIAQISEATRPNSHYVEEVVNTYGKIDGAKAVDKV